MPTGKKEYVTMGDKAIYGIAGAGSGMMLHRFIGTFRKDIEKTLRRKLKGPEGYKIGTVTTFLSLIFPEDEVKYFVGGLGAGITVDDVIQRTFKKYDVQKVEIGDLPEWEYMRKYSSLLHIDPLLPLRQKEQIILPYFPSVIYEQRPNPLQTAAIQRIIKETGINKDKLGLADCYWLQQWILHYGIYEGNEGLWPGHDRIRTLAKLMRVRDSSKWQKDGHDAFLFDCLPGYTKVLCPDDVNGYKRVEISKLNIGDKVISYNFKTEEYESKTVTNVVHKGKLPVFRMTLLNGKSTVDATLDHKMFTFNNVKGVEWMHGKFRGKNGGQVGIRGIEIKRVSELIDMKRKQDKQRKVRIVNRGKNEFVNPVSLVCVREIPESYWVTSLPKDVSRLDDDLLWVVGHYIAEGDRGLNISSSLGDKVSLILASHGIEHSRYVCKRVEGKLMANGNKKGKGPAYESNYTRVYMKKSSKTNVWFRNILSQCGSKASDKHLPSWAFSLSKNRLNALLDGYYDGDGWYPNANQKRSGGAKSSLKTTVRRCNTKSETLAFDLRLAHYILGRPVLVHFSNPPSNKYGGMWTVGESKGSRFNYEIARGISRIGIKSIEYLQEDDVWDISVEDTSNFILPDSGVIVHNCDDAATIINQVMDYCGHNIYYLLISQKPDKADGVHPLHHILAVVKSGKRLWAVEGIKNLPIIPIEYLHRIFKNLKRAVIVNSDGTYYETTEWKRNKIKDEIKKKGAVR
jgi:hypothetical protein